MKCMAARVGGTTGEVSDVPDIVFLIRHLQRTSSTSWASITPPIAFR
jgi:hypothetical protein